MTVHIAAICAYCVMRVRSARELKLAKCSRPARRKVGRTHLYIRKLPTSNLDYNASNSTHTHTQS